MANSEASVKKYITSLLIATPVVVTIQQLDKDYINTIGERIPYQKLGYNSLEHLLRSIPDTVQLRGAGPTAEVIPVVSQKSAHVNSLVTKQKVIVKNRKRPTRTRKRTGAIYPPDYNYRHASLPFQNVPPPAPSRKMYYPKKEISTTPSQSISTRGDSNFSSTSTNYPVNTNNNRISQPNNQNEVETEKLRQVVNEMKKFENVRTIEETRVTQTQEKQTEKPAASSSASNANWLMNKQRNIPADLNRASTELESSVPIQIRNNLRTLISRCPEGIWCAEVPDKYRSMFRRELDYQELGFKSLIHLCVFLSSIFHYVRPSTEDYKLYDRSRPLPDCVEKTYTMASFSTNKNKGATDGFVNALPNIDWIDIKKFLPGDILMPGEEIPRTFVPVGTKENDDIDVVVGEIYDLSKFWIYLADSSLDQLMDDMQDFYKEHAQDYLIPKHLLKEGLYCVQVIFGEYHRALIVDRMPELEDTIRVIFIDYGTMTKVSTKGLCFLHTKFSKLEAQAIRCRLANIFPLEDGAPWSREACKAFRNLIMDRDMSAKISHINWEDQYLEVYLADVTNESDIFYINDKLVEDGFAQQPDKERKQSQIDPVYVPIVKYLHLFPTFLELEHGLAPSTAEMEIFVECNLPINFCYPQYFYVDHSDEEKIIKAAEDFHEKHCVKGKRRTPIAQRMDMEKYRAYELDFSIFGDLQTEIMGSLKRKSANQEPLFEREEEFADAEEDYISESVEGLSSTLERVELNAVKEEEAVNALRRDLMVTEDIIKNIGDIYHVDMLNGATDDNLTERFTQNGENSSEFLQEFPSQCEDTWAIENGNETNSKTTFNGSVSSGSAENIYHPLSAMTFDDNKKTIKEKKDAKYDLKVPDVCLPKIQFQFLPEDNPMSIINRLKTETEDKIRDFLNHELYMDGPNYDEYEDVEEPSESIISESNSIRNTNPFLEDMESKIHTNGEILTLNPNNPFLTYHQYRNKETNDENSSGSSSSTVYDSPIVTKTHHSWSSFTDMSADTISQLGRSLCSNSSSSNSLKVFENQHSCSTQTFEQKSVAVQASVNPVPSNPHVYPGPYIPPHMYPAWSVGYSANPYYSVRFANYHVYESQFNPRAPLPHMGPPGIAPPPGFYPPAPKFGMGGYGPPPFSGPTANYRMQVPSSFYGAQQIVEMPQPQNLPQGPQISSVSSQRLDVPLPSEVIPSSSVTSDVCSTVGQTKDFYESYNEQLRQKMSSSGL